MNLSPGQLAEWFYTAFGGLVPPGASQFPPDAATQWITMLAGKKGRERSAMISGLKQGINDALTMVDGCSNEQTEKIDAALAAKGLPSIRKMEIALRKKHQRILTRGSIQDDEEFYIIAEILSDLDFDISKSDRARLGRMSYSYETRAK